MLTAFFWILNASTVVVVYVFWIKPLLSKTPAFASLYAQEESFWAAIGLKFAGLKQKLTSAIVYMAGALVYMYDYIAPKITGMDVTPITTKLAEHVPQWMWPIGLIALTALLDWFRSLADRRGDTTPPTGS